MSYYESYYEPTPWYVRAFWFLVCLIIGCGIGALVAFGFTWLWFAIFGGPQ